MALTYTARFGLPQWSDSAVDGPTMDAFDAAFAAVEEHAAFDMQGAGLGSRPAAGTIGTYYTDTTTGITWRDNGTSWVPISYFPAGVLLPYAGGTVPAGFLPCDGSAVSRTTYAALFAAIGTTFGVGDGSTTFRVPGLNSTSPNSPRFLAAGLLGEVGGSSAHGHSVSHFNLEHSHALDDRGVALLASISTTAYYKTSPTSSTSWSATSAVTGITVASSSTGKTGGIQLGGTTAPGGATADFNTANATWYPPYTAFTYIIKF